ncbi:MAG: HlyD family efflux transporter periplasmic adaptor subunit [Colwellia sp.]|nr:HlyD family efflux transporter periplasmic adaptor subunit [Colwellia sp.]
MTQLFRKEAVEAQTQRLVGSISLAQPLSIKITSSLIVAVVILTIIFLFSAEYARKETVQGFLRPDKGLIKSYSNRNGTIEKIFISEGQFVTQGTPLIRIISQRNMNNGEELSEKLINELEIQINLLAEEEEQLVQLEQLELIRIEQKQTSLNKSREVIIAQQLLLKEKLALFNQQNIQFEKLAKKGHISELEYQEQQERHINVRQEAELLIYTLINQQDELSQLKYDQVNIPQQYITKKRELKRKRSDLSRQLSETQNEYSYVVSATHAGMVTSIQVVEGETLNSIRPLLTIFPEGAQLVAELLLPTRSAGFIEEGDIARLRFDAFPHQRFGFLASTIIRIDKTLITQNDVDFPVSMNEPVYRLQAELNTQFIQGYGKKFNLKSGMLFNADIMLDKRTLIEWLLEPIYSLNGRLN